MSKDKKAINMLNLCVDLLINHSVSRETLKNDFNVSYRTIERYIDDAQRFLFSRGYDIKSRTNKDGTFYDLVSNDSPDPQMNTFLNEPQLLLLTEILASSRILKKEEAHDFINTLQKIAMVKSMSQEQQNIIKSATGTAMNKYREIKSSLSLKTDSTFETIEKLYRAVYSDRKKITVIKLAYTNLNGETKEHSVQPVSMAFDSSHLYVRAVECSDMTERRIRSYRVDRINSVELTNAAPDPYIDKEDYARKPVPKMMFSTGNYPEKIEFICRQPAVRAALDSFPENQCVFYDKNGNKVDSEEETRPDGYVKMSIRDYPEGCMFWLMSQGENVTVLTESVRAKIKHKLEGTLKYYSK